MSISVIHHGRGGYIELEGKRYSIEMFANGFAIHFPDKNRHPRLQEHLRILREFAEKQNPKWTIENRSRKYK